MIDEILESPDENPPQGDTYDFTPDEHDAIAALLRENLECMQKILKNLERK